MDKAQFLLVKLAEECSEVSQRALKQLQFGKDEIQPGQLLTNKQRLLGEIKDLIGVLVLLEDLGEVPPTNDAEVSTALVNKKNKMQKYLNLSTSLGRLPEMTL